MNLKDLIIPAIGALLTLWFIQYIVIQHSEETNTSEFRSGQLIKIPEKEVVLKPINTDIVLSNTGCVLSAQTKEVETSYGIFTFSTYGASLERFVIKRKMYGTDGTLSLILPSCGPEKEIPPFLVALQTGAPLLYEFTGEHEEHDGRLISYRAQSDAGTLTKTYKVYHDRYQMDLTLTVEPKQGMVHEWQPRIIFPAPLLHDAQVSDEEKALIYTDQHKLDKKTVDEIGKHLWVAPSLVGAENRYCVIAAVHDKNHFIQRAYFKKKDKHIETFLEGPVSKEVSSWTISFFLGPKEVNALETVDARLLSALDYGFFAWLGRIMMALLNFFYRYLHNYGWAIIALTICIRLLMMPFSLKSQRGMKKTAEIQKKLHHIDQQYKNDPETLKRKREELSMQAAAPFMWGCLILLLQVPLLIGLSSVLRSSIELYHAPFIWWIKDLSARDPYYLLPLLAAAGLFIHTGTSGSFEPRQRISMLMMVFVFLGITANFSAGLVLFTVTSLWMGVVENRFAKNMAPRLMNLLKRG
jgi:YidC/Oxa1 family membrane protein insertase